MRKIAIAFSLAACLVLPAAALAADEPAVAPAPAAQPATGAPAAAPAAELTPAPAQHAPEAAPAPAAQATPAIVPVAAPAQAAAPAATEPQAESRPAEQPAPQPATTNEGCPAAAASPAHKPVGSCPPLPGSERDVGPYWTEKCFEAKPFIPPGASYPEKAFRKLGRGVANVISAPIEIINQPLNFLYRTEQAGVIPNTTAILVGIPVGVGWMVFRALGGTLDLATFLLPTWDPVVKPEFVTNDFQRRRVLQIKNTEELRRRLEPYRPQPQPGL